MENGDDTIERKQKYRRQTMAVNEFMHPRNRYREKPNFQHLVQLFPELNEVASVDLAGKVKLDYRNRQAVHLLSKCLLDRDFGLKLELPPNKLVPTLPLRLNYIHWLEDIGSVAQWQEKEKVRGIDIGCGASCIYPLLAVVQSNQHWHMVAIEKSVDSLESAQANVTRNMLQHCISVKSQKLEGNTILLDVLKDLPEERFDFCMCNPPFFDSNSNELKPNDRTGRRREPSNASTGSLEELSTEGGEVKFIEQIIEESLHLKDRITVYTTMIGHKKSYEKILRSLESRSIQNITVSRFCQGNTTRWAVAWSFDASVPLSLVPNSLAANGNGVSPGKKKIPGKALSCRIFTTDDMDSVQSARKYITSKLQAISINVDSSGGELNKTNDILLKITARENTWSHQRRKRRAAQISSQEPNTIHISNGNETEQQNGSNEKKPRLDDTLQLEGDSRETECTDDPYLTAALNLQRKNDGYYVALQYIAGIAGKDAVNQILQYLKNTIKAESTTDDDRQGTKCLSVE
ncbi:U6 small nuclear RNA (adenine-(43)-N(6))-methyltransferase [Anopheles maculipalpis]|uniref:U6 small nuclear RNA (adenine-(43)-N(6))-methyltransferase n=1 Tax=Anopheles maculipalpis TaxID=1496333 RepID=UPI002158FDF9|nr:U6 small nuclear RNA (adenine-(43)-N(6))-methyltransferase [Anopheles maculipalpis]